MLILPDLKTCGQYAVYTTDVDTRESSSSGGVFSELSKVIFANGGIVIGAAWEEDFSGVSHISVASIQDLRLLRGSKYVPSNMREVYDIIRSSLLEGKQVLFSGTPCQTAAIRRRFGYSEKLILCAVFCHSVPAGCVWKRYLKELQRASGSTISSVDFKNKKNGWRNATVCIGYANGKTQEEKVSKNAYMRAFISGLSTRGSCLNCRFRGNESEADIMIGDFWGVEDVFPELDDYLGISAVITFSRLGDKLLKEARLKVHPVEIEQIVKKNPSVIVSVRVHPKREWFFKNYEEKGVVNTVEAVLGKNPSRGIKFLLFRILKRIFKEKANGRKY